MLLCPAAVPVQVVPAGMLTLTGCIRKLASVRCSRGRGDRTYEVTVDIDGTLHQRTAEERASVLARHGAIRVHVAAVAGDLDGDLSLGALRELAGSSSVDDGFERTSTVRSDDVEDTADGPICSTDLRKGVAGESHCLGQHGDCVLALAFGMAKTIGGNLGRAKDGSVDLSDTVGAGAGDDTALDTETSGIATSVTGQNGDLAVGGNKGRSREGSNEDAGVHHDD